MEAVSLAVGIAGALAFIISLIFIYRQTAIVQASLRLNAKTSGEQWWFATGEALLQWPHLRTHFYEDEFESSPPPLDSLSDADRSRLNTIAEMILDGMDAELRNLEDAAFKEDERRSYFEAYARDAFRISEFLRDYLEQRASWYPSLVQYVETRR